MMTTYLSRVSLLFIFGSVSMALEAISTEQLEVGYKDRL